MGELLNLDGKWELYFAPEGDDAPKTPEEVTAAGWRHIAADVPGNVELDLQNAGLAPDAYYGANCYQFRKYEFYTWWFLKTFSVPAAAAGNSLWLCLDGVDTYADIWLDGALVGKTDNMLVPHEFDISAHVTPGREAVLAVHVHSTVNRARQEEFPVGIATWSPWGQEMAVVRKPAHSFGWDISARMLSAGLWKSVRLEERAPARITEVYYYTIALHANSAKLGVRYRFCTGEYTLDGYTVEVEGKAGEHVFREDIAAYFTGGSMEFTVDAPRLWWPLGYGEQPLYDMTFRLMRNGEVVDSRTERFGIRTVEIVKEYSGGETGEFLVKVNGVPVLGKGTNWVFLDCLHSRDRERLAKAHAMLLDLGCNMVRMWGGNVYEDDAFYDLCDEAGILVWQDFALACCLYPQTAAFMQTVEEEAAIVIRRLRNHASLFVWAGDNEVDAMYFERQQTLPHARYNAISQEVLSRAVAMQDPFRDYIPSSPYVPAERGSIFDVPEQHVWGPRDYFKSDFYKNATSHFTSECGYHGCPAASALKRFIPPEELWPYRYESEAWTAHSTDLLPAGRRDFDRNGLMIDQVKVLFGNVPEGLEDFALASQISQAEALKFFIENTRIRKWRTTGLLWWNLLDGWPQMSDAVVDYYFGQKLAYHYIKRAQQPICLLMGEPADWQNRLVLANDGNLSTDVRYKVYDGETGEVFAEGNVHSPANQNVELSPIRAIPGEQRLYVLEWTMDGKKHGSHYAAGFVPMDLARYKKWLGTIEKLEQPFEVKNCYV